MRWGFVRGRGAHGTWSRTKCSAKLRKEEKDNKQATGGNNWKHNEEEIFLRCAHCFGSPTRKLAEIYVNAGGVLQDAPSDKSPYASTHDTKAVQFYQLKPHSCSFRFSDHLGSFHPCRPHVKFRSNDQGNKPFGASTDDTNGNRDIVPACVS
jgi:hypothetical protein